ncbi:MAG: excinuclease ABC subunit C [Calditrichaeota bacterium]|nr:excinuclease ABC subunit C [Calditrichota bacterium]
MKSSLLEDKLLQIPRKSGVYLFKDKSGKVIYVGKAKILRNRVKSYFIKKTSGSYRTSALTNKVNDVDFIITNTEQEALLLENNLIKTHSPRYNVQLKDDKSYPYIRITNEPFPQVIVTRKIIRDGSKYVGPYTNVYDVRQSLKQLHKVFQVRTCRFYMDEQSIAAGKHKVCLDYHIRRCAGPCEGYQSKDDYRQTIRHVEKYLTGHSDELRKELKREMKAASDELKFEKAASLRNTLDALQIFYDKQHKVETIENISQDYMAIALEDNDACLTILRIRNGKIIGKQQFLLKNDAFDSEETIFEQFLYSHYVHFEQLPDELYIAQTMSEHIDLHKQFINELCEAPIKLFIPQLGQKQKLIKMAFLNSKQRLDELKIKQMKADFVPKAIRSLHRDLKLQTLPRRIECFDNSNIQGSDPVASMVVFINGKPAKSEYRKFNIKTVADGQPDDFKSMYEIISRRYKRLKEDGSDFPDLIVVDGGKGQLSSAQNALIDIGVWPKPLISLAKRLEEVYVPGYPEPQQIPRTSSAIRLLQQVRDEAHRFAITFHREKRNKRTLKSELADIEGVGLSRQKLLLNHFGSLKKIKEASLQDLQAVAKLPKNLAVVIYQHFNP